MPFTCALSGHRVLSRQFSKQLLQQQLRALLEEGADTFLCGMALGFDLICAETLTALRTQYRLRLVACIPCADQACRFTPAQKQAYLRALSACDESVEYTMVSQGLSKALFGNTGGLFVMEVEGAGSLLASAFGDILALDVTPGEPLTVDNEHVVAWDAALEYHIEVASGMFGFTTGEGLVNTFTGAGRVYIQTRNLANLAQAMHPYLPTSSN